MDASKKKIKKSWKMVYKKMDADGITESFKDNLKYALSKDQYSATINDDFIALALSIRDRLIERWIVTQQGYHKKNVKRVYYLSMEFLIGRLLGNYIFNLGLEKQVKKSLSDIGFNFDDIEEQESDAGLGNGGLGRLAACFLDSMATLGIPAHGYGIRYDYGIFHQKIKDGHQVELPDEWLKRESPWELARLEYTVKIKFYGKVKLIRDGGKLSAKWHDTQDVLAVPYDYPIPGYKNDIINTLRLWSAKSTEEFDFDYFNSGDYEQAVEQKILSENISKVLYPNDDVSRGRELRLKQEYFFVAASIADIIRRFKSENSDLKVLPKKVAIQLNDTHPSLAVPEFMRVLLDEYAFDWETSWNITKNVFAYTNHTLMGEALEKWSVNLLGNLLPRHLQIIYEINARFLVDVARKFPGDTERLKRMSIIEESEVKKVRMAYLAIVGSHSINGVSKLHSNILKDKVFKDFYDLYPEKFNNKTNGITQRRWLLKANPELSSLISKAIGNKWVTDLKDLKKLDVLKDDSNFRAKWQKIKDNNKKSLAQYIKKTSGIIVNPDSMFDVQIKRIHEYKRQILFGFYIISEYLKIKNNPKNFIQPRTFIIGGKAAPGYYMAKLSIKFLTSIADIINTDRTIGDKIKMVFLENYRVSLAEKIFPASELSEQISTAGTEASGTGNMKFMLNGALTVGTLDGANVEMADVLGNKNIFIFGLKAHEVTELRNAGYKPQDYIKNSPQLSEIFSLLKKNFFSPYSPGIFNPIIDSLTFADPYFVCADFDSYRKTQDVISKAYQDRELWIKKSIINTSKSGIFSSDRTIREYAKDIWKVPYSK